MVAASARIVRIVALFFGVATTVVERGSNAAHARHAVDGPAGAALPGAAPPSRQLPRPAALLAPTPVTSRADRRRSTAPVEAGRGRTVTGCFLFRRKPRLVGFLEVRGQHFGEDELPGARLGVVVDTVLWGILQGGTVVGRISWG